jgi:hypothetical protein
VSVLLAERILARALLLGLVLVLVPACDEGGEDAVVQVPIYLAAPGGIAAMAGCETATVRWDPVANADGYVIYLASQAGVTPTSYASLPGGRRVTGLTVSPATIDALLSGTTHYFVVAAVAGAVEGPVSAEVAASLPTVGTPGPIGTLHTITGTLRGLVIDGPRGRAYATNETQHRLEVLDLVSNTLLAPVPIGASPWGLDLLPDGSRLLVCLRGSAEIAVVDLTVDPPVPLSTIPVPPDATGAANPKTIGCATDGRIFFACEDAGAGYTVLRQLTLSPPSVALRTDAWGGQITDPTTIVASGNRQRLVLAKDGASIEYYFYDAPSDTFVGPGFSSAGTAREMAVNADGTLCSLGNGPAFVGDDLRQRGLLQIGRLPFAFHPTRNLGFSTIGFDLTVVDLDRFVELDTWATGVLSLLSLRISSDGIHGCGVTANGLARLILNENRPPVILGGAGFAVNAGETAGVTLGTFDADGDAVELCAENLPANASFDPVTRRLTFAPSAGQAGQSFPSVRLYASDGLLARPYDVTLTVPATTPYPFRSLPGTGGLANGQAHMAYDSVRDRVYVAGTGGGQIDVYDVGTNFRRAPIIVGSGPIGLDLTLDCSKLVVCPVNTQDVVIVDLTVDPPAIAARVPVPDGPTPAHRQPYNLAIAADGHALFSTFDFPASTARVCDLDLATNTITVRADVPGAPLSGVPVLRASRDRSVIFVSPSLTTTAALYRASTHDFGTPATLDASVSDVDVNSDGTRFLADLGPRLYDGSLSLLGTVSGISRRSCLRQGSASIGYRHVFSSGLIQVLDLTTFTVTDSFGVGGTAGGWMITDSAGTRLLTLLEPGGLVITTLP